MTEGSNEEEKLIAKTYYDVANGAAYFGPRKIHEFLKKKSINRVPSEYKIRKWLERNDNYTLQKPARRKIMRAKVLVAEPYEQYDADIADLSSISAQNDNYRYLLIVIDIFTRYLRIEKLKTKTGRDVLHAFKIVFARGCLPKKLRTDSGSEFKFKGLKDFLKSKHIYHHITLNTTIKANYNERVILTLKRILYRFFTKQRSYRYVDQLQNIVDSSNAIPHRSLNYTAPKRRESDQQNRLMGIHVFKVPEKKFKSEEKFKHKQHFNCRIGDLVRISHLKTQFLRAYDQQWSSEIFKIHQRFLIDGIATYKIKDFLNEQISGNFYSSEIQKVFKDEKSLWYIEKKIRSRTYRGRKQFFVKFDGWDSRFNCWIDADDIQEH